MYDMEKDGKTMNGRKKNWRENGDRRGMVGRSQIHVIGIQELGEIYKEKENLKELRKPG